MEENLIKKSGAERQAEVLVAGLEKVLSTGGELLNRSQKTSPAFYGKGLRINPVNQLLMAMHSDAGDFKTNQYTTFNATHERGEAIRKGQKGVPFVWINSNEYVSLVNPEEKISRAQYQELNDEDKKGYKVNPREEVYTLFNIDQTTMPYVHKEEYAENVAKFGKAEERRSSSTVKDETSYSAAEEKNLRVKVNEFISNISENLVAIRKDGSGIASYDSKKDVIHIPTQKSFNSYPEYVQETVRQVVHATGIPQRLGREGSIMEGRKVPTETAQMKESLVEELASAVKMLDLGLPARVRQDSLDTVIPRAIERMREKPEIAAEILNDVNRTVGMIRKAENGEKINLIAKPSEKRQQDWAAQFPMDHVPEKFERMGLLKDDEGRWALYAKPEGMPLFATFPSYQDVSLFFDTVKNEKDEGRLATFKTQFAQKYYAVIAQDKSKAVDLFKSKASPEALALISKANIFKGKDDKLRMAATLGDEKMKPKLITADQWLRMGLAEDKKDYKVHLAAILYNEEIAGKLEEFKHAVSPEVEGTVLHEENEHREYHQEREAEQARKQEQIRQQHSPKQGEDKADAIKSALSAHTAVAMSPMLKQFHDLKKKHPDALLLFRCGDFYETYSKDAQKTSEILGITLTRSSKSQDMDGRPLEMAGFPHQALDTYLPKLIRAGQRVAICDQIENKIQANHADAEQGKDQPISERQEYVPKEKTKTEEQEQHHGIRR